MTRSGTLQRFVDAQTDTLDTALRELRTGAKRSHWMWFVFPQLAGLGRSATARYYAIADLAEAKAYLADPVLGPRLAATVAAIMAAAGDDPIAILGEIDAIKLRSSLTLFEAAGGGAPFAMALDRFFVGERDSATLALLRD